MTLKAAVQVDLDGIWTIYKYHGLERELWPDPVFTQSVPRFLALFDELQIRATFFVVGIDTTIPEKTEIIRKIANSGHEIANHSYSHFVPFGNLDDNAIENDLLHANQVIEQITGEKPIGFRSPAYDIDERVFKIVERLGFRYDASVFPTYWANTLHTIEKKKSGIHQPLGKFGGTKNRNASLKPYSVDINNLSRRGDSAVTEIPLSVIPIIRTPMHRSVSQFVGQWYYKTGVVMNRLCKNPVSVLFHGIELVDSFRDENLPSFKWITSSFPQRVDEIRRMIRTLKKHYVLVPTCQLI